MLNFILYKNIGLCFFPEIGRKRSSSFAALEVLDEISDEDVKLRATAALSTELFRLQGLQVQSLQQSVQLFEQLRKSDITISELTEERATFLTRASYGIARASVETTLNWIKLSAEHEKCSDKPDTMTATMKHWVDCRRVNLRRDDMVLSMVSADGMVVIEEQEDTVREACRGLYGALCAHVHQKYREGIVVIPKNTSAFTDPHRLALATFCKRHHYGYILEEDM